MKNFIGLLAFTSIALINTVHAEGDIENGRALSTSCTNSGCHGADGMSNSEAVPNLAGQKASYLMRQLEKYQSGEREDGTMGPIAGPLSAQDREDLAAFFANNGSVAIYSLDEEVLSVPYVKVGDTMYNVEMSLDSFAGLIFSVSHLEER